MSEAAEAAAARLLAKLGSRRGVEDDLNTDEMVRLLSNTADQFLGALLAASCCSIESTRPPNASIFELGSPAAARACWAEAWACWAALFAASALWPASSAFCSAAEALASTAETR